MEKLSKAQGKALLNAHCIGLWGGTQWKVYQCLLDNGYIAEMGSHLVVTDKGKQWCDLNHLSYEFGYMS